jgi:hypothetical protein
VLVDATGSVPQAVMSAQLFNLTPLHIPTFQRGITWELTDVLEFLSSRSQVVGHAVLAKIHGTAGYTELVDGLQRFTVGTALLNILYPLVLAPTCTFSGHKAQFAPLANYVNNAHAVFSNNHQQLHNHLRRAIQDQYREFYITLEDYVNKLLTNGQAVAVSMFASSVVNTFCGRQIAIDDFTGFATMGDLINTFLGINTIRVELNTVDLLRTLIVEKATIANWPPVEIEAIENQLTDVFMRGGTPVKPIIPIATSVQKLLPAHGANIFPSWNGVLVKAEVEEFLDFIDSCVAAASQSPYLGEIAEVGSLPFSILVLQYYRSKISNGQSPSFVASTFSGPASQEDADLHEYLRACYRVLLAGIAGQLGPIADSIIQNAPNNTSAIATEINAQTGAGSLRAAPTQGWIAAQLEGVNKDKAKRIFNACLLPLATNPGGSFSPLQFGRSANKWQIDHLIPHSLLISNQIGANEVQRIRNFAPFQAQYNQSAKNTPCAQKLLPVGGLYQNMVSGLTNGGQFVHPYITWLIQNQSALAGILDDQTKLSPNTIPDVGDARIKQLEQLLLPRL